MKEKYPLIDPITFEGNLITHLDLNFESLDGKTISAARKAARRVFGDDMDGGDINMALIAMAAGIPIEATLIIKARDIMALNEALDGFFNPPVSAIDTETPDTSKTLPASSPASGPEPPSSIG